MYSTAYLFRLAKVISVFAIGFMGLLIVFGNITDYYTNYYFVEHVMKMDTVFPNSTITYRSINNTIIYHLAYGIIILMEAAMTFCCLKGSWLLFKTCRNDAMTFNAAKNWAVAGLTIGILTWFLVFQVIGGEWFAMWQSANWNGLTSAGRIVSFLVAILILLHLKDE